MIKSFFKPGDVTVGSTRRASHAMLRPSGVLMICLVLGLQACGADKKADDAKASAKAAQAPAQKMDPAEIQAGPEMMALLRLATLEWADVREQQRLSARLELNGYKTARIGAPVTGRISDIKAVVGQDVRQGDRLAEIVSQELTAAQLAFLKAHSAEQLAARAVGRAELLLNSDVIGSAELQRRQNELTIARAEKRASADQMRVLGLSQRAVEQLESSGSLISAAPIAASQSGVVIERKIALGQVVQPSDALFVVSDLHSVWAIADVPEQDAAQVQKGQSVQIEIPALGNEKRTGQIVFVADVVNPETRTVRVGVDLENPDRQLKPQMLITMLIDGRAQKRMVVPSTAVVREADQDNLYVQQGESRFRLVRVKLGPDKGGKRALLEPLLEGQRVVVDGGFHLNNERQRRLLEGGSNVPAKAKP